MILPNRIYFTGVPGSRWSGIAQTLEALPGFNTTDRNPKREYKHHSYGGHVGAYYGPGMEFDNNIWLTDRAYTDPDAGCQVLKSHHWAYNLDYIYEHMNKDDMIMLVYRPDMVSFAWWHEAGGFQIQYPSYSWYENSTRMFNEIQIQNKNILEFACKYDCQWEYFTESWMESQFGTSGDLDITQVDPDILVTTIRK